MSAEASSNSFAELSEQLPATVATSPSGALPPHIPDYELLRLIGQGSYGQVWLARSVTGAFRAVKIVFRSSFDRVRPYERELEGIKKFEPISQARESQVAIFHVGRIDTAGFFY